MSNFEDSIFDRLSTIEKTVGKILDKIDNGEPLDINEIYSVSKKLEYKLRDITDKCLLQLNKKDSV